MLKNANGRSLETQKLASAVYVFSLLGGGHATTHIFRIAFGFISSGTDPCVFSVDDASASFLLFVDRILISGSDKVEIKGILYKLKKQVSDRGPWRGEFSTWYPKQPRR